MRITVTGLDARPGLAAHYVIIDIVLISIGIILFSIDYVWRSLDNLFTQIGRRLTRLINLRDIGGGIRLKIRLPSKFRL